MQGLGGAGVTAVAGCLWGDEEDVDISGALDRETVDPDEIKSGGTLRASVPLSPDLFDPPESSAAAASVVHNLFWEELLKTDLDGNVYPWLSKSYEQVEINDIDRTDYEEYMISVPFDENGLPDVSDQIVVSHPDNDPETDDEALVLTVNETQDAVDDGVFGMHFHHELHEGITFHNGEELTAENVVRSYERYENTLMSGQVFDQFLHAEADGEYAVDLYAQLPDAEAVDDILWRIFPTEHIENVQPGDLDPRHGTEPVGISPWEFEEFENEEYLIVSRTDDYWLEEIGLEEKSWWDGPDGFPAGPVIDEIDIEFIKDDSQRNAALQEREIDVTYGVTAEARTNFYTADDFRVSATPGGSYDFLQFPVQTEPWDDVNVRRAVNHLIPRSDIVSSITDNWANEATVPLPELASERGTTDYEQLKEDLAHYNEYDPDRAEELIEASDYEPPFDVTIHTNSGSKDRIRKVELIEQTLNQSGLFEATLEPPGDLNTLVEIAYEPDYYEEGNLVYLGLSGSYNPHSFCEAVHHPDQYNECCNMQNPPGSFPDLIEQMDAAQFGYEVAQDPDLRAERYDELWEQLLEINANSFVEFELSTVSMTDDVRGYNAYPFSSQFLFDPIYNPIDQQLTYLDRD
ncbi:ABC transporter substrate-binding protein [Halopiger djelfimassiliensis]|uniref:ABC transporter substrate-binding protein n=1 Tax=Halopiger djelfimassiliensis TaxID=1293047 RepID=UPI000677EF76|nr:ABC transporter substrate-binding protein [Halopiger djelfimassiliensis]